MFTGDVRPMLNVRILALILLLICAGCQSQGADALPTLIPSVIPPTATPLLPLATRALSSLPDTLTPLPPRASATPLPSATALPSATPAPSATPPSEVVFGQSVEGRPLTAYRVGEGARAVLLVGAVHGGFEAHTAELLTEIAAHYRAVGLPADLTLWVVPALNPDGVARGRVLAGRFNASGVDLNRNWPCGWQAEAYFRDQVVSAGAEPLSEPETRALADFIIALRPAATLFFHAAAAGVYAGTCGGDAGSAALAASFGQAAGYDYGESFSAYPVTGTAPAWVNSLGLPAADVELASATDIELTRNLAGVQAALCWVSEGC